MDRQRISQAIVLAGGFGTRLQGVLPGVPKPLAPVRGLPFIHYILRWLEQSGVERVIACTGYLADKMDAPFLDIGTPESCAKAETILPKPPEPAGAGAANS